MTIALKAARIFDGRSDRIEAGGVVLIEGEEIAACGPDLRVPDKHLNGRQLIVLRFRPRAEMRDASVVGFMPSSSAAPRGPETLPFVCFRAAAMASRS
jgi:hypothetical protein